MSNETEVTLKPCPFCGGEAKTTKDRFGVPQKWKILWGVYCDGDCGTFFDCREPTEVKSITAWNTRAESTKDAQIAELQARLDGAAQVCRDYAAQQKRNTSVRARTANLLAQRILTYTHINTPLNKEPGHE